MDGLPLTPTTAASIIGFLLVVIVGLLVTTARAISRGDWIPRATHERELEAARHDANEWRAEGRIKDQAILVDLGHVKAITEETGKTLHAFIAGLQKVTDVTPRGGGGV